MVTEVEHPAVEAAGLTKVYGSGNTEVRALRGVDLRGLFAETFGLPAVVNTDLTAHALAEYHYGSGRGARRFLCMAMGTGLGAGVVINGQALRFIGGKAGDTGRVIVEPGGPPDTCSYCIIPGSRRCHRRRPSGRQALAQSSVG